MEETQRLLSGELDSYSVEKRFVRRGGEPFWARLQVSIVRSIVDVARGKGIHTVAEGVEDADALAALRSYGVDYAQGFHIARPQPRELA